MTRELLSANHGAALAAFRAAQANRVARGFGSGVYPITPQSECIELLAKQKFQKGEVVRVESEHSAMAVCMGFALAGLRSFTASSSNGLAYMAENVYAAAYYRLPIVMMAVNRTLGPPWNIWVDHGDTLMLRDAGWMQFYCEDNQEVVDTVLLAYRLAEDPRLLVPAMVCQDAFVLSHTMALTDIPEQAAVDGFLPPLELPHRLNGAPRVVGGLDFPRETEVHRREHHEALGRFPAVYAQVQDEFQAAFGRRPAEAVVPYRLGNAETVVISMGTTASTVRAAVDQARARGQRVGALRLRVFRPFPSAVLETLLAHVRRVGVIDRDISPGLGGVLWSEVRGSGPRDALCQGYILGLGGGDIRPVHVTRVLDDLSRRERAGEPVLMEVE